MGRLAETRGSSQWLVGVPFQLGPAVAGGMARRHPDAPFHTAGSVETGVALAKEFADNGLVCLTGDDLGGQAFSAGLVDEIAMDVATGSSG